MSTFHQTDPTTDADIERRIALTFQFMREVIADPRRLDEIPASGSVVVVLPADDPEFAANERALAERLAAEGRHVVVVTVGAEPISEEGWERLNAKLPSWSPAWAAGLDRDQPTIVYDQERDALFVDLSGGKRQGWGWPRNDFIYVLIDDATEEAFGYLIPEFIATAVRRVPDLARVLMLAEMRPLMETERGQLEILGSAHLRRRISGEVDRAAQLARNEVLATLRDLAVEAVTV